jgi:hypothetical protein
VQSDHRTYGGKHSEHVWQSSAVAIQPQEADREEGKQAAGEPTRQRNPEGPGADVAPAHETHSRCDTQQVPAGSTDNRANEIAPAIGGSTLIAEPPPDLHAQEPEWQAQQETTQALENAKPQVVTHGDAVSVVL